MAELTAVFDSLAMVSAALMGGVYFAFNVIVMPSLSAAGDASAITIMNHLNRKILRSVFMPLFFGSTLLFVVLLLLGSGGWNKLAAGVYLLGMFGVTAIKNVPLNNGLQQGQLAWPDYCRAWCRWNGVRAISSVLAAGLVAVEWL